MTALSGLSTSNAIISGFVLGFSIMAAGPLAFQYAAEVTYPAAESI